MIKAVIFDLFETLVSEQNSNKYTTVQCAEDLEIDPSFFREIWEAHHKPMNIGALTYEQVLHIICKASNVQLTPDKLNYCVCRRTKTKSECFDILNTEITKMLSELKHHEVKLALCSNCSSDEVYALKSSSIYEYFDTSILSYEVGLEKPDKCIYKLCSDNLNVRPEECLYVGDGGSNELYGAENVGMKPVRAMWYLKKSNGIISPMPFREADTPLDIIKLLKKVSPNKSVQRN